MHVTVIKIQLNNKNINKLISRRNWLQLGW